MLSVQISPSPSKISRAVCVCVSNIYTLESASFTFNLTTATCPYVLNIEPAQIYYISTN